MGTSCRLGLWCSVLLYACTPTGPEPSAALEGPVVAPTVVAPTDWPVVDTAPSLDSSHGKAEATAPDADHYATVVELDSEHGCSQSWANMSSTASLVLDLEDDGRATACRGRRSHELFGSWDGEGPTVTDIAEQQGLSGSWHREGEWIDVDLALDDTVCAQRRAYVNLDPEPWHLRCTRIEPQDHDVLSDPVLGCRLVEPSYGGVGFTVRNVLPDEYILLAPGPGLRVTTNEGGFEGDRTEVVRAAEAIEADAWTRTAPRSVTPPPQIP